MTLNVYETRKGNLLSRVTEVLAQVRQADYTTSNTYYSHPNKSLVNRVGAGC